MQISHISSYRVQSYHTARALLNEMANTEKITVDQMLQSDYLTKNDVALFRQVNYVEKKNEK
jgi:hypothetical protein